MFEKQRPQIAVSTQSLLRLTGAAGFFINAARWGMSDYAVKAQELGADGVMYEPLRQAVSPARRELFSGEDGIGITDVLQDVLYLTEPARSETAFTEYLNGRIIWQLIYAVLENDRFSSVKDVKQIELLLATAHLKRDQGFPTRVYEPKIGEKRAAILDTDLKNRVYAQDHAEHIRRVLDNKGENGRLRLAARIVDAIQSDAQKYPRISGIELNIRTIAQELTDDRGLLREVVMKLLNRKLEYSGRDLVQVITVQPFRSDLPGQKLDYAAMMLALDTVNEAGFSKLIVYAPGGGKPEKDVADLRDRFKI